MTATPGLPAAPVVAAVFPTGTATATGFPAGIASTGIAPDTSVRAILAEATGTPAAG